MDVKKTLGLKIKKLRQQKGLTQEQFAEKIGIATRTLAGIEIGESFVSATTIENILNYTGLSFEDFIICSHLRPIDDLMQDIYSYLDSKDPAIGTQIRNNMTGTRYLQHPGVNGRGVTVEPLTTVHYTDGRYSSIPNSQFNKLLKELQQNPNNWNPVIKSDASIGQELVVNNPAIAGRYFRPAAPANDMGTNNLITRITPEHHNTMTLEKFDNMILNLLG